MAPDTAAGGNAQSQVPDEQWIVVIDNGTDYSAALPQRFNTEAEAEAAGEDWLLQFRADNDITDEDDPAGYEVQRA